MPEVGDTCVFAHDGFYNDETERYRVGYVGVLVGGWSGGVNFVVTKDVMSRLVQDHHRPDEGEVLLWDTSGTKVVYTTSSDATFAQVLEPAGDEYEVPSWTWGIIEPDKCDEVVGQVPTPSTDPLDIAFCIRLQIRPDLYKDNAEPLMQDAALWGRLATEFAARMPGAGVKDWRLHHDPDAIFEAGK